MPKTALAFVIAVVLGSFIVVAQETPMQVGIEGQIQTLVSSGFDKSGPKFQACGKYFNYMPTSDPKYVGIIQLVFIYDMKDGHHVTVLPWGTDKFQLRVVPGTKVPILKVLRTGGSVFPWAEIIISPTDREQAPCLDKVKTVGSSGA